mmetsp:Transcript_24043/g.52476  ORF Transcript_24043/g.52476 Transcript_24043/m.52476 type:complete len:299 (-) Transcript_24043:1071-1967(-)
MGRNSAMRWVLRSVATSTSRSTMKIAKSTSRLRMTGRRKLQWRAPQPSPCWRCRRRVRGRRQGVHPRLAHTLRGPSLAHHRRFQGYRRRNPMVDHQDLMVDRPGPMVDRLGPMAKRLGPTAQRPGPTADRPHQGPMADRPRPGLTADRPRPGPIADSLRPGTIADRPGPIADRLGLIADHPGPMARSPGPILSRPQAQLRHRVRYPDPGRRLILTRRAATSNLLPTVRARGQELRQVHSGAATGRGTGGGSGSTRAPTAAPTRKARSGRRKRRRLRRIKRRRNTRIRRERKSIPTSRR